MVNVDLPEGQKEHNSFLSLYTVLRKQSMEMLHKNRLFGYSQINLKTSPTYRLLTST